MGHLKQFLFACFIFSLACQIYCQENAQYRVPKSLVECYNNDSILVKDNRLPMTMATLIDLIRKIENSPRSSLDLKKLTISLIHRFRQDGIEKAPGVVSTASVLPYSPSGFQFSKHRILLSRLIPGNALEFPNDTLSTIERCTLHSMLSSSFETNIRGDEATQCTQLARYRAERIPRDVQQSSKNANNYLGDVEILNHQKSKKIGSTGKLQAVEGAFFDQDHNEGGDLDDDDIEYGYKSDAGLVDLASNSKSQCPVENGVIWTPWGAVSAGTLLAGIAAGLEPQKVQLRDLLAFSTRSGGRSPQANANVDNKWAATLAGDLAEVALIQAPALQANSKINVGAAGGWNSTTAPRWYFLSQRERLEMTDAEIRGGLDGLIIASHIADWRSQVPTMKLSQLLDMYYSERGVLNTGIRSCNRANIFTSVAPIEEIKAQTNAFSNVLDREVQLKVTLGQDAIKSFSDGAAEALSAYIPQSLNDPSCQATSATPNDNTTWRVASQIYIFLDTSWKYTDINPIFVKMLHNIDMKQFGSSVTLFNANDPKIIFNTTDSPSDILQNWKPETHHEYAAGLNLPNILRILHNITVEQLDGEKQNSSVGGRSMIALIVPNTASVNEADTNLAIQRLQLLKEEVPDLKFLYITSGSVNRFEKFVQEANKDLFGFRAGENIPSQVDPIIRRIQEIPRRIINPRCGSTWEQSETGTHQMNQYIEPGSVNYYRIHPNYFFHEGGNRKLKIQVQQASDMTVCTSRTVSNPRKNLVKNDNEEVKCSPLTSETYELDLTKPCEGHSLIHLCPPVYISVDAATKTSGSPSSCSEPECQYPDQIRFEVKIEQFGCYSSASQLLSSFFLILLAFCLNRYC